MRIKCVNLGSFNMKSQLQSVINLQLLMDLTTPGPVVAPVLSIKTKKSHFLSAALPMDCVIHTTSSDTVKEYVRFLFFLNHFHSEQARCHLLPWPHSLHINCRAFERLLMAMADQLHEMEKVMLQHMKGMMLLVPEPLHVLLPEPNGLVTVVYPAGMPDSQLEMRRMVRYG